MMYTFVMALNQNRIDENFVQIGSYSELNKKESVYEKQYSMSEAQALINLLNQSDPILFYYIVLTAESLRLNTSNISD